MIRIEDVAFVRFRAPDLAQMQTFLEEFGLVLAKVEAERLFMRGAGTSPVLHITEQGEPGFAALGLRAACLSDLEALAKAEGLPVQPFDAPGGGSVVVLTDPNGHRIEVVAGQTPVDPLPLPARTAWNGEITGRTRTRQAKRVAAGPSHIIRFGHCVLNVADFRASEAWYKARFGFITSDEIEFMPGMPIGAFLRCDRGATPSDHHTLFLLQAPSGPGFNHAAFEVADLDDLMLGHQTLKDAGRHAEWGVGRHILGSQVFDYWRDPWGHTLEHWTDGDLFTADDAPNTATLADLLGVQWGPPPPPTLG